MTNANQQDMRLPIDRKLLRAMIGKPRIEADCFVNTFTE